MSTGYSQRMTTAHAYELPSGEQFVVPAGVDDEVSAGHVVPLWRNGRPVAALTPIDPDQAWFWTPEWQGGEREADEEIAREGKGYGPFNSVEEMFTDLDLRVS